MLEVWNAFDERRGELTEMLVDELNDTPDIISQEEMLSDIDKMGKESFPVIDLFLLLRKYERDPLMVHLIKKRAKEYEKTQDIDQEDRETLCEIIIRAKSGKCAVIQNWENLNRVADYCSGKAHGQRENMEYITEMCGHWEDITEKYIKRF
ncbi:MAG: hypothetical protein IKL18_00095 [Oscillospiraceae bacterium]|nr:hypothetical protein [Oscillospiraceae bacterium]